jgi:hypothetical protein
VPDPRDDQQHARETDEHHRHSAVEAAGLRVRQGATARVTSRPFVELVQPGLDVAGVAHRRLGAIPHQVVLLVILHGQTT